MAQVDYFLKIDGIEGESTDDRHKGEIEIESFSWGATQTGAAAHGGGGGAGKVSMQDFHFTTRVSKASPTLFLSCATGQHMKTAILTARKAGGEQQEFLKYTLSDVLITSYKQQGSPGEEPSQPPPVGDTTGQVAAAAVSSGGDLPVDSFSLDFAKIEFQVTTQRADGSAGDAVTASWDRKLNRKG
jgi:type VI secretion system secreted protein Hcp